MTTTPILSITEVAPAQNNKEATINDAFVKLEAAFNKAVSVSLASADATLVSADYTGNFVFVCTGASVSRNLIVPNTERIFAVKNTGSHSIIVKTASPSSTATVASGSMVMVYCDGANNMTILADSSVAGFGTPSFTLLSDAPGSYTGEGGKYVRVKVAEDGLEFDLLTLTDTDVPAPTAGYFLRRNAGDTAYEWVASAGATTSVFSGLTDVPASYTGEANKIVQVKGDETGLQFVAKNALLAYTDLTDGPASYSGASGKVLTVKSSEDGVEFTVLPTVGTPTTHATDDLNAGFEGGALTPDWTIVLGTAMQNLVGGSFGSITPYAGSFMYYATAASALANARVEKTIDLTLLVTAAELDNNARVELPWAFAAGASGVTGKVTLAALNSVSSPLGSVNTGTIPTGTLNAWQTGTLVYDIPSGTRKIKITVDSYASGTMAAAWDQLDPTVTVIATVNFIALDDTPNSYAGEALKTVRVNAGETALEFHTPAFTDLSDVPSSFAGNALQVLRVNAGETALEFSGHPFRIGTFISGLTNNNEEIFGYVFTDAVSFPGNFAGSYAKARDAAAASTTYTVYKNGVQCGDFTFASSGTSATFTTTAGATVAFNAGDVMTVTGPVTADTTLASLKITFMATW